MSQAKDGDVVHVHYTGKLTDDSIFDSSHGKEPLSFEIGSGQIIPGFEREIIGMEPGSKKTFTVEADEAYGPYREDRIVEVEREMFPQDLDPTVGQQLQVQQQDGETAIVTVTDIGPSAVTLDANHPLAGQELTFEVELVAVE